MNRINQYKQRHAPFGSDGARMIRARQIDDRRRERRAGHLSRFRNDNIVNDVSNELECEEETREDRMTRLQKWKIERDLKKKLETKKKQPVFKVGIPHRNLFLPTVSGSPVPHCHRKNAKQCKQIHPSPPKRVTRATEKRLAAKQDALLECDENAKTNILERRKILKMAKKKKNHSIKMITDKVESIAPNDYVFKGPSRVNPLPMFGQLTWIPLSQGLDNENMKLFQQLEVTSTQCDSKNIEAHTYIRDSSSTMSTTRSNIDETEKVEQRTASMLHSTEELNEIPRTCSPVPAEFSPYIVTSRGKSCARKEQKMRLGLNDSLGDIIPTKNTVMQNLNISIEEEERTAQYYKILLKQQIEKLTNLCAVWEKIQGELETTEDGKYMINQAIGQAKLLMQKKFERFRGLVLDCETGKGEMLVRCRDLQAFWDIILMQIKDCDSRFKTLSEMKEKNWIEKDADVIEVTKKPAVNKKKRIVAKSSARAFIGAMRKRNLGLTCNSEVNREVDKNLKCESFTPEIENSSTPQWKIPSSKKMGQLLDTSFTVMHVTRMGKVASDVKLNRTKSYVNAGLTPGKGILKKFDHIEKDGILPKSTSKVNFNEIVLTSEHSVDDVTDNIKPSNGVEKRLDFDDDSFNEEDHKLLTHVDRNLFIPNIGVISPTPSARNQTIGLDNDLTSAIEISTSTSNIKTPRKTKAMLSEDLMLNTRVLRNRAVIQDNLSMRSRSSLKKNNSVIVEPNANMNDDIAKENKIQTFNQRRSARRSVKFNVDEDCTACAVSKPALPMTPQRNKKLSLLGNISCQESIHILPSGNLILFDSPVTPRRRSKRVNKM